MTTVAMSARAATPGGPTTRRLPDFVIIGSGKCGTTTLFEYLRRHPQVYCCREKEPEFFADKFDRGWDWYGGLFAGAEPGQVCGEASTIYTWWREYPVAAARMGRYLPHARLIYIMRHPVERTYSDYGEQIKTARARARLGPHLASFEDFIESYPHLVRAGEYIRFIEEYLRHFSREALLLLLLDDLKADPTAVLRRVWRHIGVGQRADFASGKPVRANTAQEYNQWQLRLRMTRVLRRLPGVERLGGLVPKAWRERLYGRLEQSARARRLRAELAPPPIKPQTRRMLLERFREPNRRLAELLGRDLSHWNQ